MPTENFVCDTPNLRLDKFLNSTLNISRSHAQRLIADGRVLVDGHNAKSSTKLQSGAQISVTFADDETSDTPLPQDIPLDILFEDDDIIVLNKPAGLVVHPALGHTQDTLVNALLHHVPNIAALHPERPGIVHRLDRDTSGVMVVAKNEASLANLQAQFKARTVEKIYLTLVHGLPKSPKGIIDVPLGRDPHHRQKFAARADGKPARTHYAVIETFEGFSLLSVKLETGRTHQIRVHLAWLEHPVVGDTVYGYKKNRLRAKRQFLHASQLSFSHPRTGEKLAFKAPLHADLQEILDSLPKI